MNNQVRSKSDYDKQEWSNLLHCTPIGRRRKEYVCQQPEIANYLRRVTLPEHQAGEEEGRKEDATHGGDPAPVEDDDEDDDDDDGHKIHSTRKVNLNKYRFLASRIVRALVTFGQ